MRPASALLALLAALCGLAACVEAHPKYWVALQANCSALPAVAFGPHTGLAADTASKLTLKRNGAVVAKLCPGVAHRVQVAFPQARQYILVSSRGTFASSSALCPNRLVGDPGAAAIDATLTIPCTMTSGSVKLALVSVQLKTGNMLYQRMSATFDVLPAASCPASTCNAGTKAATPPPATTAATSSPVKASPVPMPVSAPASPSSSPVPLPSPVLPSPSPRPSSLPVPAPLPAPAPSPAPAAAGGINLAALLPQLLPKLPVAAPSNASGLPALKLDPAAALTLLKNLGQLLPTPAAKPTTAAAPASVDVNSVVSFVKSLAQLLPGAIAGAAAESAGTAGAVASDDEDAGSAAAPADDYADAAVDGSNGADAGGDVGAAIFNLLTALAALLPETGASASGLNLGALLNFLKAVGGLASSFSAQAAAA